MLDITDFESWQQRIRLYCLGKDNGENIMKSITEGPFQMGTFIQTPAEDAEETEGALKLGPNVPRIITNLSTKEKKDDSGRSIQTQSSESLTIPQIKPSLVDNCQMDTGSTSTDNLIESITNTLAFLRTSSNARNNATVQDDRVVVQDVRGRYNANNQGRPFQRNNARGNVVAGNVGGQNRVGNMNPGQVKPII
ncbi:hypothetical protein Tco_0722762 [Tanacetum coccineum]